MSCVPHSSAASARSADAPGREREHVRALLDADQAPVAPDRLGERGEIQARAAADVEHDRAGAEIERGDRAAAVRAARRGQPVVLGGDVVVARERAVTIGRSPRRAQQRRGRAARDMRRAVRRATAERDARSQCPRDHRPPGSTGRWRWSRSFTGRCQHPIGAARQALERGGELGRPRQDR